MPEVASGAAFAVGATAGSSIDLDEEESDGTESEEETEEAQVCWGAVFSFLPVILEVGAEFVGAAMEAGICQYLAMIFVPIYQFFQHLLGIANAPPSPPAFFPPAPPPPPTAPTLITSITVGTFTFAQHHPIIYLLLDFTIFMSFALFFLYLKDISEWHEARMQAARQAEQDRKLGYERVGGYQKLEDGAEDEEAGLDEDSSTNDQLVNFDSKEVRSGVEMARELRVCSDRCEELEVKVRVHRKAMQNGVEWALALKDELKGLQAKRRGSR